MYGFDVDCIREERQLGSIWWTRIMGFHRGEGWWWGFDDNLERVVCDGSRMLFWRDT